MAAGVSEYIERVETDGGEVESDIYVSESVEDLGDFFDDASLVNIPTAYKATKLYSIKPTDGSGDFTFARSTTATRVNESGLIESVGVNVPRIDYFSNTPALLLEPQRTNLFTQSNDFSGWTIVNGTLTANFATSPDGTTNASKINFTTGGELYETTTLSSGATYTLSFYAKVSSGTFDFTFGNIDNTLTSGTATTDWQRFEVTQVAASTSQDIKLDATDTGDLLIYGFQVEAGTYATSYISTSGATVTRTNDVSYINDILTKGLITATEFTLFIDLNTESLIRDSSIVNFLLGTTSNRIIIYSDVNVSSRPKIYIDDGAFQNIALSQDYSKIAIKVQSNAVDVFVDGSNVLSTTQSLDFTANSNVSLNGGNTKALIGNMLFFPTALTDAECITLTTI